MSSISASTSGLGPMSSVSQDMSPPGPAMNPSSDIVTAYRSLLMGRNDDGSALQREGLGGAGLAVRPLDCDLQRRRGLLQPLERLLGLRGHLQRQLGVAGLQERLAAGGDGLALDDEADGHLARAGARDGHAEPARSDRADRELAGHLCR